MATKYTVLTPIQHDQEFYSVDSEIELSDKAAKPLLEAGAIAPRTVSAPKGDKKPAA